MVSLTTEIRAELSGKTVEDRRTALTELHEKGCYKDEIRGYLLELLAGNGKAPDEKGFVSTIYAHDNLWLYSLEDSQKASEQTIFFFQEMPDHSYKTWPR